MQAFDRGIFIAGSGAWGTAIALAIARTGQRVRLWGRDRAQIAAMRSARENSRYLPGIALPEPSLPTRRSTPESRSCSAKKWSPIKF